MPLCGGPFSLLSSALSVVRRSATTAEFFFDTPLVALPVGGILANFTVNGFAASASSPGIGATSVVLTFPGVTVGNAWTNAALAGPPFTAGVGVAAGSGVVV